jgi:outer membrane murein-binding lipoprotein Lpp
MSRRRFAMLAAVVLVPITLAGCSSNGTKANASSTVAGHSASSTSQTGPAPKATGHAPTSASTSADDSSSDDASPRDSESDSDASEGKPSDTSTDIVGAAGSAAGDATPHAGGKTSAQTPFCAAFKEFDDHLASLEDEGDQGDITRLNADMARLKQTVPAALAPDVQEITSAVSKVVAGGSSAADQLNVPAFQTAARHIATWEIDNCPEAM